LIRARHWARAAMTALWEIVLWRPSASQIPTTSEHDSGPLSSPFRPRQMTRLTMPRRPISGKVATHAGRF